MSYILRQSDVPNTGPDFIKGSPLTYDQLDGNFAAISASLAARPVYQAGPGIVINGEYISSSVVTVNGVFPVNGNISLQIADVITGPLGDRPYPAANGTVYVVSQDPVSSNNGDAYIFVESTMTWEPIAPLDTVQADQRYLLLSGLNSPMQGSINMGGWNITNAGTFFGTAQTASFVTASNVAGPFGANSILSASQAVTASFITASAVFGPHGGNSVISASHAISASYLINPPDTSRIVSGSTIVQTYPTGKVIVSGSSETTTQLGISGSLVVGYNTAQGLHSVAIGTSSIAVANYSFVQGQSNIASSSYSHAEGQSTIAAAAYSHTEGLGARTTATYAHAEGYYTTASGQYSHTEGAFTNTQGFYSHAEGQNTFALGEAAHAEGLYTTASGYYSHAEGSGSQALGPFSHAEGSGSIAYGSGSHAEGLGTIASGSYQMVIGRYNQHTNTDSYFVIGNGSSDSSRSDYLRVGTSGASITGSLIVSGAFTSSTDIQVGSQTVGRGSTSGAETFNTAFGGSALRSNTTGLANVAIGWSSLAENTTGQYNVAIGVSAQSGSKGSFNQSIGFQSLQVAAGSSQYNHAFGYRASRLLQSGSFNTTVGGLASITMTSGSNNVAIGYASMAALPSGSNNVAVGFSAMYGTTNSPNQTNNVAIGHEANYTGSTSGVYLGYRAGYFETASNMLYIANSNTTTPLIKGNFSSGELFLNGSVQITGSFVQGLTSSATGQYAHAQGRDTLASADYSHAEGTGSVASGAAAHAEGYVTLASGNFSHAEGQFTTASADHAHAEGIDTKAIAFGSHAEGYRAIAFGQYSHAEGRDTISSGSYSHAEGQQTNASASYSHAEGSGTTTSGQYSHAEGVQTQAIGSYSHAEGFGSQAIGLYSHVEGTGFASGTGSHAEGWYSQTTAAAWYAHAEGLQTSAQASGSHAEGSGSIAAGIASHAEGLQTVITTGGAYGHAEGWTTRVAALYAHAEGLLSTASGEYSHVEGRQNVTTGVGSHAEGYLTVAANSYAHTEGQGTYANGPGAHAEGYYTSASGDNAHAEGSGTKAFGIASHAEGRETQASASYSHTEGYGTVASGSYQTVVGQFNNHGDTTDSAFIIGNGSSAGVRSNLLKAWDSRVEVTGSLRVTGSVYYNNNKQYNYGQFQHNVTLTTAGNVSQSFQLNTTDVADGVSIANDGAGNPTRITFANTGVYSVQFSAQLFQGAGTATVYIWFKKNGTNIPDSATTLTMASTSYLVPSWNFFANVVAGDYVEIAWQSTSGNTQVQYAAATGNIPIIPAVIATVIQVR